VSESDPENRNVEVVVRRRRTRRHRRNRIIRRSLFLGVLALSTACVSLFALRYFDFSIVSKTQLTTADREQAALDRGRSALDQILSEVQPSRPVYPYSVVPGGVVDAKELKWVAEHDPVVAAHYAGFDYDHARVVRLTLARTAFVSYRIGNHVYWMRRRISLHKGEDLITDGRITARGRCGNQVAEKPQQEASAAEPAPAELDHPQAGAGTATQSPAVPFESALVNRPQVSGLEPGGPMNFYDPFGGGNFVSLSPPALPSGLCSPTPKKGTTAIEGGAATGGKKKLGPCGTVIPTVPEPTTWVMLLSGLAAVFWRARKRVSRT
jgi:PEP-CTERM motif